MSLCGDVDAAGIRMPLHRFAGTIRRNKHRDDRAHGRLQNPLAQNDVRAGEPSRRWEARWNKWKGQLPIVICKHPVGRVLGEARFEERDGLSSNDVQQGLHPVAFHGVTHPREYLRVAPGECPNVALGTRVETPQDTALPTHPSPGF